jgi:LysM repeat protein
MDMKTVVQKGFKNPFSAPIGQIVFGFILLVFLAACAKLPERRHPLYIRAMKMKQAANYPEAARSLEEFLEKNPESLLARQEVASLYFDHLDDPYLAAYHYRRCLQSFPPDSEDGQPYQSWVEEAEKRVLAQLKEKYGDPAADRITELDKRLKESLSETEKLKRFVTTLLKKNRELETAAKVVTSSTVQTASEPAPSPSTPSADPIRTESAAPGPKPVAAPAPVPMLPSEYTVQSGDSLMKISRKLYGTSRYHLVLFEANRAVLASPSKLAPGQRLVVPSIVELNQEEEP